MLTQARAFGLQWKLGPEDLTLISIGTGSSGRATLSNPKPPRTASGLAFHALMETLEDGQLLTLTMLQWFSDSPQPWQINSEIGDLSDEVLGGRPLLRFQRYDMPLDATWLQQNLQAHLPDKVIHVMRRMDRYASMKEIYAMAAAAAELQVRLAHL
jgi:hypothetical protein